VQGWQVEKTFFLGKNRPGKNSLCRQKYVFAGIYFPQYKIHQFLFVFD